MGGAVPGQWFGFEALRGGTRPPARAAPLRGVRSRSGAGVRRQPRILKDFIERVEFVRISPHPVTVKSVADAPAPAQIAPEVVAGRYHAGWVNPRTGSVEKREDINHAGGLQTLNSPLYAEDIAVRLIRTTERSGTP